MLIAFCIINKMHILFAPTKFTDIAKMPAMEVWHRVARPPWFGTVPAVLITQIF